MLKSIGVSVISGKSYKEGCVIKYTSWVTILHNTMVLRFASPIHHEINTLLFKLPTIYSNQNHSFKQNSFGSSGKEQGLWESLSLHPEIDNHILSRDRIENAQPLALSLQNTKFHFLLKG